jgi:hypothetical protein
MLERASPKAIVDTVEAMASLQQSMHQRRCIYNGVSTVMESAAQRLLGLTQPGDLQPGGL